jgi:hypothetical protein
MKHLSQVRQPQNPFFPYLSLFPKYWLVIPKPGFLDGAKNKAKMRGFTEFLKKLHENRNSLVS